MTIELPLPDSKLTPNGRCHWRTKARVTKVHRQRARLEMLARMGRAEVLPVFSRYLLEFYWPTRARRDDDNAAASCKAYRDGIADALRIDDHTLRMCAGPAMLHDPINPRLLFILLP